MHNEMIMPISNVTSFIRVAFSPYEMIFFTLSRLHFCERAKNVLKFVNIDFYLSHIVIICSHK